MAKNEPYSYDTETIEYRSDMPSRLELARDIAAFANTKGGQIYIGYDPSEEWLLHGTSLTDIQVQTSIEIAKEALQLLRPKPLIDIIQDDILGNRQFIVVSVQKYPTPILFDDDRYYVRIGNRTTFAEEDLISALSEVIPSLPENILNTLQSEDISTETFEHSDNLVKKEQHGISIQKRIDGQAFVQGESETAHIIYSKIEEKSQFDLTNLLSDSIQRTREDLTTQRSERLHQARITFIVATVVLILAIILVFVGIVLIFTNKTQAGIVSSVASIVSAIVSGLAFAFNKQSNDRMDEYAKELNVLEKSYTSIQFISFISDVRMRDEAIRDLAKNVSMVKQIN